MQLLGAILHIIVCNIKNGNSTSLQCKEFGLVSIYPGTSVSGFQHLLGLLMCVPLWGAAVAFSFLVILFTFGEINM